jgi:AAA ATPase domain
MIPSALTVSNYRSFADPQRLELRPVTLLYGYNNMGKSALLRSLPLLSDAAGSNGLDALNLGGRVQDLELDFEALRWKGRAETDERAVVFGLHWDDDPVLQDAYFSIWEEPDWQRLVVDGLVCKGGGESLNAEWRLTRGERRADALSYQVTDASGSTNRKLTFKGLRPELSEGSEHPMIEALSTRLEAFSTSVLWLRSLRPSPKRVTHWYESARWSLSPSGLDALIVLASEPTLAADVSSWYREHLGFELIIDVPRRREVRALLRNRNKVGYDVDIVDTGEGLGQVLPVLTALAMARHHETRGGPSILAIEEPEAHLHPNTQQALAERVCEVAAEAKPRIVLETHSEQFLLAMQRAILKGKISKDDVLLYWVRQLDTGQSVAEPVVLTDLAQFDGHWPWDAFDEGLDVASEIQDLRNAKEEG